jgi:hypothetical protein
MTALAADRTTIRREEENISLPVAAAKTMYLGALAVTDASGNAEPGTTATGKTVQGRVSVETIDNSAGAAGDLNVEIRRGIFKWANSGSDPVTAANVGDTVYIEDDQTVAATGTGKSAAGIMEELDADGGVWVNTRPQVGSTGLLAANNLSDVGTPATAAENIGVGVTDSPTFADVTTTDDVTVGDDLDVQGKADVAETLDVVGVATFTAESVHTGGVNAGPGTAGAIKSRKTSITAAQLKALAATPITVIPAVASKMHLPIGFSLKLEYGSEVLVEPSAPDEPQFKYVNGAGVVCSATADAGEIIVPAADAYAWVPGIQVEGGTLAEHVNVPIVLHNTGGEYTGNASNDTVLEVTAFYVELDVS